jgi:hypothetical protein
MTVMTAFVNSEKTIPVNIIVLFSILPSIRDAKEIEINIVPNPNANPSRGKVSIRAKGSVIPKRITTPAPREAPEDTPSVYDEASGFFNTDCMTAPLTDNAAPTIKASKALGSLRFHSIATVVLPIFSFKFNPNILCPMIFKISNGGIYTLPIAMPKTIITRVTHIDIIIFVFINFNLIVGRDALGTPCKKSTPT